MSAKDFAKLGEQILSNNPAQKNGFLKGIIDLVKPNRSLEETAGRLVSNKKDAIVKGMKEAIKENPKMVDNTGSILRTLGDHEIGAVEEIAINNLAKSVDDASSLTKEAILEQVNKTKASLGREAKLQRAKDWFTDPIRTLRSSSDEAERALAGKQMMARYGLTAGAAAGGIGVVHDMVSDDDHDLGLLNVPIAGAAAGTTAGVALGVSKLLKVK